MSQFMMLLYDDPSAFRDVAPEEMQRIVEKYSAWMQQIAARGKLAGGEKLKDEGGRHITARNGKAVVRDGPYAEAKEVIGGYFVIEASGYDEAVEISKTCPHLSYGGRIELREVDPVQS